MYTTSDWCLDNNDRAMKLRTVSGDIKIGTLGGVRYEESLHDCSQIIGKTEICELMRGAASLWRGGVSRSGRHLLLRPLPMHER